MKLSEMFQDIGDSNVDFRLTCSDGLCNIHIGPEYKCEIPISQLADCDAEETLCSLFNQAMFEAKGPVELPAEDAVGSDKPVEDEPVSETWG